MSEPRTPPQRASVTPDNDDRSGDFNPDASPERKRARNTNVTPQVRRYHSSIASAQKIGAVLADPNEGKCLLTHQTMVVDACHLVPRSSPGALLSSLEWAWGNAYETLNVDTRYNIVFLRADLHRLLDSDHWMLVPDLHYVDALFEISQRTSPPGKIEEIYGTTKEFKYYIVPLKDMKEILISRVTQQVLSPDPYEFVHHKYPYASLGPLLSHVQPHFAIYNAGRKWTIQFEKDAQLLPTVANVRACLDLPTTDQAGFYLSKLSAIYRKWIMPPPASFSTTSHSPSEFPGGAPGNPGDRRSEGSRRSNPSRAARSTGSGAGAGGGSGHGPQSQYGGRRVPDLQRTSSVSSEQDDIEGDSFASDDEEATLAEITWNKKYVSGWLNQVTEVVTREGGREHGPYNDPQLGSYAEESCRSPFLEWHPTWMRRGFPNIHKPPPDTSKFSSNDWSLKDCFIRLPDPVDLD